MQIFLFAQGAAGEAASAAETTQMARKGAKNAQQMADMYGSRIVFFVHTSDTECNVCRNK